MTATPRSRTELIAAGLMGPGCGNPTCPCETRPWQQACQEWAGGPPDDELPSCPQCGWVKEQHLPDVSAGECPAVSGG